MSEVSCHHVSLFVCPVVYHTGQTKQGAAMEIPIIRYLDRGAFRFGPSYRQGDVRSKSFQKLINANVRRYQKDFDGACNDCGDGAAGVDGDPNCRHRNRS